MNKTCFISMKKWFANRGKIESGILVISPHCFKSQKTKTFVTPLGL